MVFYSNTKNKYKGIVKNEKTDKAETENFKSSVNTRVMSSYINKTDTAKGKIIKFKHV